MARVVLAFGDVGMAVPLQEELERAGHQVRWNAAEANGPADADAVWADAVLLTSGEGDDALATAVQAFRDAATPPALVLVGTRPGDTQLAARLQLALEPSTSDTATLSAAIAHAIKLRFAGGLRASSPLRVGLRALGLAADGEKLEMSLRLLAGARNADVDMVREALRWYASQYVTVDPRWVELLRQQRALHIPEVEFTPLLDGTRCLQTILRSGKLEPWSAARLVWALASIGAIAFTNGPPDQATSRRRRLAQARLHLVARQERLAQATFYDVLEVTTDATDRHIEHAVQMLALRYGPAHLERLDLSEHAHLAAPTWEQVLKARAVLLAPDDRARYHRWLAQQPSVRTEWAASAVNPIHGAQMMARGQKSLLAGELFKAVSDMAAACRMHPHHPDYEASLAWARYRAEASRDKEDRAVLARREREVAEASLEGHRPWPRALLALGLLCVAEGDADAARWHLHEALACDPNLPAAKQMLARIG